MLKPGSQTIIATVFGEYLGHCFSADPNPAFCRTLSLCAIAACLVINYFGGKNSATAARFLTSLKLLLLLSIVIIGVVHAIGYPAHISANLGSTSFEQIERAKSSDPKIRGGFAGYCAAIVA